jgi:hypothetical protein
LPGFLFAQPHIATSINFAFFNRGEVYMKIEIDIKELATLINMIGEQREPVGNADDLAKEICKNFSQEMALKFSCRT